MLKQHNDQDNDANKNNDEGSVDKFHTCATKAMIQLQELGVNSNLYVLRDGRWFLEQIWLCAISAYLQYYRWGGTGSLITTVSDRYVLFKKTIYLSVFVVFMKFCWQIK